MSVSYIYVGFSQLCSPVVALTQYGVPECSSVRISQPAGSPPAAAAAGLGDWPAVAASPSHPFASTWSFAPSSAAARAASPIASALLAVNLAASETMASLSSFSAVSRKRSKYSGWKHTTNTFQAALTKVKTPMTIPTVPSPKARVPTKIKKSRRPLQLNMKPMFFRKHMLQHSSFSSQIKRMALKHITYRDARTRSTFKLLSPPM
mmetsp:Transcript_11894/g.22910  ORF Transcript_11894/g.22910 Transcript_11894/m.22910 type:complete len:206 (+) Transcript_11894:188-805(+)